MDRKIGSLIDSYYYNENGSLKKNAIYCQQIDRFIVFDSYNSQMSFETANILSSKIASTVYLLPEEVTYMDNSNCINYTIFNKTVFKRSGVSDLIQSQTPTIKKLNPNNIIKMDVPEDYKNPEGISQLIKLKEYADFVNKYTFAIEIANSKNWKNNKYISETFFQKEWNNLLVTYEVDTHEFDKSVYNEIKKILYFANSIDEARTDIYNFLFVALKNNTISFSLTEWFFSLANEPNPF
jgi:hypothetical protein